MGILDSGTRLLGRQTTSASAADDIDCNGDDTACQFLKLIASPFASEV